MRFWLEFAGAVALLIAAVLGLMAWEKQKCYMEGKAAGHEALYDAQSGKCFFRSNSKWIDSDTVRVNE